MGGGSFRNIEDGNGIEFPCKKKNKEGIWRKEGKKRKILRDLIIKEGTTAGGETILVPTQSNHLAMEQIYGLSICMRIKHMHNLLL